MQILLLIAVVFLAFANGSNDNYKGVATLRGSGWYSFSRTLGWAAFWTFAGSLMSLWLARTLLPVFSGAGLIGEHVDPVQFLLAVATGAAITVLVASYIGMPISTTHALLGALSGTALLSSGWAQTNLTGLINTVALPLLLSPLLAILLTRLLFPVMRHAYPITKDCICLLPSPQVQLAGAPAVLTGLPTVVRDTTQACAVHSSQPVWRGNVNEILHWLSAGWISFSRGANDTAKIAALLLLPVMDVNSGQAFLLVAAAMAAGGMLGARGVARTVSERITPIPAAEGTAANLATALLVTLASPLGLAVSTTHVSIGGILGVAQAQGQSADWGKVRQILLSWLITLPLAAAAGALVYSVVAA